jgi:DNA ligase-associated metallophosphoesterase
MKTASSQPLAEACAGETLWLLPERALWWPVRRVLFVADLHFGKAAAYRALGQPVPAGTTRENLDRLNALLRQYMPAELVFLGDFLHAAEARTASVLSALTQWRESCADLHCILVRGNHDRRAGDPPASLGIDAVSEPWVIGPFAACHHPQSHPTHHVIAGHVHPVVKLHGRGREHLRLPCFVLDAQKLVLPAFGEFTGGWIVEAEPGVQVFPAGGDAVWRLPVA